MARKRNSKLVNRCTEAGLRRIVAAVVSSWASEGFGHCGTRRSRAILYGFYEDVETALRKYGDGTSVAEVIRQVKAGMKW